MVRVAGEEKEQLAARATGEDNEAAGSESSW